jgi:ABC-2 type transport system permease protein
MMCPLERADGRWRRPTAARLLRGQFLYQFRLLVRTPITLFATLIVPLMVLLAVNLLFRGKRVTDHGMVPWAQFFTPAMVAFAVVTCCYAGVITSTTVSRDAGILKRLQSTPLPAWIYLAGRVVIAGAVTLLAAVVLVAVGAGLYGFRVIWDAVPAALLTLAAATFCFCSLGLAVTVLVGRAESGLPVAWGTMLPVCFISDVFQPLGSAPKWLLKLSSLLPVRPLADDLERLFNPLVASHSVDWSHLLVITAWGIAAAVFALVRFRWEPRRPASHGADHGHGTLSAHRLRELLDTGK